MGKPRFVLLILTGLLLVAACGDDGGAAAGGCEEGVVESDTGLEYEELECGDGEEAGRGDSVTVKYEGALESGEVFDSGTLPPFQLGAGGVIAGFDEGITGMKVGGKRRLTIPPDLAYGEEGRPPTIPPNSTLIFEIELLEVESG